MHSLISAFSLLSQNNLLAFSFAFFLLALDLLGLPLSLSVLLGRRGLLFGAHLVDRLLGRDGRQAELVGARVVHAVHPALPSGSRKSDKRKASE